MKKLILSTMLTAAFVLPALLADGDALASVAVHPDCVDHPNPVACTQIVQELSAEMIDYVQDYIDGDIDAMASYFANPGAVTGIFGEFYRGYASYRDDALVPLYDGPVASSVFDLSGVRYQVVSSDLIVMYGPASVTFVYKDGSTSTFPERVMMVWTRSHGDPQKPFVAVAGMYEML